MNTPPNKAHSVFGDPWETPIGRIFLYIMGWFSVPAEVLLRRDFGERWLTRVNFSTGLLVLLFFTMIQGIGSLLGNSAPIFFGDPGQVEEPSLWEKFLSRSMYYILLAYLAIGSYHFFRMWWRNQTNTPLRSFVYGVSRLQPVAPYIIKVVNIVAVPLIRFYMLFLPKWERQRNFITPPLVTDAGTFTDTVIEPLFLLLLGVFVFEGSTSTWLIVSSFAVFVVSSIKAEAQLNRVLDFRDSVIEARVMAGAPSEDELYKRNAAEELIMQQVAHTVKESPQVAPMVKEQYPDLMSIIEDMNKEKSNQ